MGRESERISKRNFSVAISLVLVAAMFSFYLSPSYSSGDVSSNVVTGQQVTTPEAADLCAVEMPDANCALTIVQIVHDATIEEAAPDLLKDCNTHRTECIPQQDKENINNQILCKGTRDKPRTDNAGNVCDFDSSLKDRPCRVTGCTEYTGTHACTYSESCFNAEGQLIEGCSGTCTPSDQEISTTCGVSYFYNWNWYKCEGN